MQIMKKVFLFLATFIFFILSSCIPSLHSIVNDENRITDDRIIGTWKMEKDVFDEDNFKFSVKADDIEGELGMKQIMKEIKKGFQKQKKYSLWQFERAAILKLKYNLLDQGNVTVTQETIGGVSSTLKKIREQFNTEDIIIEYKEELPYYILTYYPDTSSDQATTMKVELTKIGKNIYMDMFPISDKITGRFSTNFIEAHTFVKVEFNEEKLLFHSFDTIRIEDLLKSKKVRLKHEVITKAKNDKNKIVYEESVVLTAPTKELRAFIEKYGTEEDLFDEAEELTADHE